MKLKLHKVLNVITSLSLLVNSIYAPLSVYAQEITPSPTPAPIIEETASPEPSVSPSEEPIVSPSPTIESTILPTVSSTPIESPLPSENQSTEPTSTVTPLKTEEKGHIEAIILENTQASSIEGYDLEYQDEGSATIQTDKLDYAPTDTVLITGSEFLPNTEYGIEITSDTGNFKFSDRVTSDESGGLFYTYQLDGTYRPNYVVVINSGEVMIASTSFSDSDWPGCGFQCEAGDAYVKELQLVDSGGSPLNTCTPGTLVTATIRGNFYVNSNSDRKAVILLGDIYQGNNLHYHFSTSGVDGQCVGDALSHGDNYRDLYTFSWTCGEAVSIKNLVLSWTTGNTSCANFFSAPSCGNRTTKCYSSQDFIVSSPLVANFSANNVCLGNSTTFTDSTAGGITPYSYSWDFGDTNSSSLQNPLHMYSAAGSYSVNLDVDDSAVPTQSDNESETVEVWANPQVDFSFSQSSCPGMAVNFTNNSGAGLPNGGQIQNYLWSFGDGTTSTDINPSHSYSSSGVYTVALSANDFNSCSALIQKEITVNACYGDLTVRKNVITDVDDQVDEFDVDTWTWDLDDGDQDYQTGSTQNILVGSHLINEDPKNDYHVVNLSCTDPAGNTTDYGAVESAQIDVSVNGLECTFVNAIDTGLVTFEKEIYEDDPYLPSDWEFFVDGQTVAHGGQIALPVGSYNVDELNSDNDLFNLTSVSGICSDPNDQGADKSATLIVTKDGGTCTFTNTRKKGEVSFLKIVDDNSDVSGWVFTVMDESGTVIGTYNSGDSDFFNTGITYTVSELGPDTYHFSAIGGICSPSAAAADVAEMDVDEQGGECRFSNNVNKGSITVIKGSIPEDEQDFYFTAQGQDVSNFSLDDDGDSTNALKDSELFENLFPGSYTFAETLESGWDLSSLMCTSDIPGKNIGLFIGTNIVSFELEPRENVICTFTNTKRGSISGTKWHDLNADGNKEVGETGLESWTIGFRKELTGSWEEQTQTLSDGTYLFSNVVPGDYYVCEEIPNQTWYQSYPDFGPSYDNTYCHLVTVDPGQETEDIDFGNFQYASVQVCKVDVEEQPVPGWTVYVNDVDQTTGLDGCTDFVLSQMGEYLVTEESRSDWTPLSQTSYLFTAISGGQYGPYTFQNYRHSTISGHKYEDINGDGFKDAENTALENWEFRLEQYVNENWVVIGTDFTNASGEWSFVITEPGKYRVHEILQNGWEPTNYLSGYYPSETGMEKTSSTNIINVDFLNFEEGYVQGRKYEDINANGTHELSDGEERLDSWTVRLYKQGDGWQYLGEAETGHTGNPGQYKFENLSAGTYYICEVLKDGWRQTGPVLGAGSVDNDGNPVSNGLAVENQSTAPDEAPVCWRTEVTSGSGNGWLKFGNFELGKLTVCKNNDYNGNGQYDEQNDEPLSEIDIILSKFDSDWNLVETLSTQEDGCLTFEDLEYGSYKVEEDYNDPDLDGYYSTNGITYYEDILVDSGYDNSDDPFRFLNTQYRSIFGKKYNDLNGNGSLDPGEAGLKDWVIYLDNNFNGVLDGGDVSTFTDDNGDYEFDGLVSDFYRVREENQNGWIQTDPTSSYIDVDVHEEISSEGNNFGNFELGKITVCKYDDLDGDGQKDEPEPAISGVEINLFDDPGGEPTIGITTDNGCYTFEDLEYGTYKVTETIPDGYYQTYPLDPDYYDVQVESGYDNSEDPLIFLNAKYGQITVEKITDPEETDTSFDFELGNGEQVIGTLTLNGGGIQTFQNELEKGSYSLTELETLGWQLIGVSCTGVEEFVNGDFLNVNPGDEIICTFTNLEEKPSLSIEKSNDKSSASAGDVINYTLIVTNTGNIKIANIQVTDVLPGGFEYVLGTAKVNGVNQEPSVNNNVLTWFGIDLGVGGSVEILYQVKVGSDLEAGVYTNLATCQTVNEDQLFDGEVTRLVFGLTREIECNDGVPVSSIVSLGQVLDYSGSLTPQVLGISTELPATGSATWILILSGLLGIFGVSLRVWEKRTKNEKN